MKRRAKVLPTFSAACRVLRLLLVLAIPQFLTAQAALQLSAISFFSQGNTGNSIPILFDQPNGKAAPRIVPPQWKSPGDKYGVNNMPVGYVRNTMMSVTVDFLVTANIPANQQPVTIEGNVANLGKFSAANVMVPAQGKTLTVKFERGPRLPNAVTLYEFATNPMSVDWSYTPKGGVAVAIGSTKHEVYVTLAKPLSTPVYLTALYLGTFNGGAVNAAQAFDNTWALFSNNGGGPGNVTAWDSNPIYYYRNDQGANRIQGIVQGTIDGFASGGNLVQMLARPNRSAKCGAFGDLLRAALAVNGLTSAKLEVFARANLTFQTCTAVNRNGMCLNWVVTGRANQSLQFLVNDWQFANIMNNGTAFPWQLQLSCQAFMLLRNPPACPANGVPAQWNDMAMVPNQPGGVYGQVTSQNTIPGQNTVPPSEKIFSDHVIVKFVPPLNGQTADQYCRQNDCYYDPSYGVTYRDPTDFEGKALSGYGYHFPVDAMNVAHFTPAANAVGNFIIATGKDGFGRPTRTMLTFPQTIPYFVTIAH